METYVSYMNIYNNNYLFRYSCFSIFVSVTINKL